MVKNLLKREEKNLFTMLVKDLQFFTENISSKNLEWAEGRSRIFFLG